MAAAAAQRSSPLPFSSDSAAGVSSLALEAAQASLSAAGEECLEALAAAAAALNLRDTSPPALLSAALAAASAAQVAQDGEEQVYDMIQQLEAQATAAAALLRALSIALAELEQASARAAVEAEGLLLKAPEELAKVEKYRTQQAQHAQRLAALGYDSQLNHGHVRALGERHAQLSGELQATEAALQRYVGLPADMPAAKAAHLEKLQELQRLRERLAAGLDKL